MTSLTKNAAELYFVLGVLITSLLADNETTTYLFEEASLQVDVETSTQIPPVTVLAEVSVDNESTTHNMTDTQHKSEHDLSNTISDMDHTAVATEPVRHSFGRGLPHFHLPDSRWGPFFEEGAEPHNITARVGSTVMLDCRIGLLQDKTVTWLHHKEDSIHLLTVGRSAYSSDERITLSFRYPNNFRLQIIYVTRRDEGLYECQVATHPPKVKRIFLKVTAPEVQIADESGRQVSERYYKAGSSLELTCIAKQLDGSNEDHPIIWKQGERTIIKGISSNVSSKGDSASSTLTVAPLQKRHSGNYTCAVGNLEFATVAVHVLNGELPAAVHHGNAAPPGSSGMHLLLSMACVTAVCLR